MKIVIMTPVRLLGESLMMALRTFKSMEIVGTVQHLGNLRDLLGSQEADLALIDVTGGIEIDEMRSLAAERPQVKLVALGLIEQRTEVIGCAKSGFVGYVARDISLSELERSLHEIVQGRTRYPAEIVASLMRALFRRDADRAPAVADPTLTQREGEILRLLGRGLSNKEMARELDLSTATVKNHVHNLLTKLGLSRRNDAMRRVREEPWIAGPDRCTRASTVGPTTYTDRPADGNGGG
jgi:two-component system, NarL family, nitrate/nitrite response regulator NarL